MSGCKFHPHSTRTNFDQSIKKTIYLSIYLDSRTIYVRWGWIFKNKDFLEQQLKPPKIYIKNQLWPINWEGALIN